MQDITKLSLPEAVQTAVENPPPKKSTLLRDKIDEFVLQALDANDWRVHPTALYLGITPKTIWRWKQRLEKRRNGNGLRRMEILNKRGEKGKSN
jgi:transcriptional regulator of acetoin/glycerol metabolism